MHSIYLWVDFAFLRRAELKPACILLLLISKFILFYMPRFIAFAEPALSFSSVKEPFMRSLPFGRGSRVTSRGSRVEKSSTIIFERRQIKISCLLEFPVPVLFLR